MSHNHKSSTPHACRNGKPCFDKDGMRAVDAYTIDVKAHGQKPLLSLPEIFSLLNEVYEIDPNSIGGLAHGQEIGIRITIRLDREGEDDDGE